MTWTRRKALKCSEKWVVVCNQGELLCTNPKGLIIKCKGKLEVVNGLVFKPNTLYLDKCEVLQVDSLEAYTLGWVWERSLKLSVTRQRRAYLRLWQVENSSLTMAYWMRDAFKSTSSCLFSYCKVAEVWGGTAWNFKSFGKKNMMYSHKLKVQQLLTAGDYSENFQGHMWIHQYLVQWFVV